MYVSRFPWSNVVGDLLRKSVYIYAHFWWDGVGREKIYRITHNRFRYCTFPPSPLPALFLLRLTINDNVNEILGKRNGFGRAKDFDLPPFSLIRDFSNRNTRWNVSKISVNHTRHTIYGSVNTSTRDGKMADSTDSFEFTSQYSEMFEDRSVELPDLEETQIWDSPNVTVSFFLFSILNAFMNTYEYLHQLIQWIGVH